LEKPTIRLVHPSIGELAFTIGDAGLVLGRAGGGADVELTWDDRVSRRHARLFSKDGEVWFEDLGSRNGSWQGARRVVEPLRLKIGEHVLIGETGLVLADPIRRPASVETEENKTPGSDTMDMEQREAPPEEHGKTDPPPPAPLPPPPRAKTVPPPQHPARNDPRFVTNDKVELAVGDRGELKELWLKDISKGGIFVATNDPPKLGQKLEVKIKTSDGTIALRAMVVHALDAKAAQARGMVPGVGLQFVDTLPEQKRAIQAYIDGLAAKVGAESREEPAAASAAATIDKVVHRARVFLEKMEQGDTYGALELKPEAADATVKQRVHELKDALTRTLPSIPATRAARVERALGLLERLAPSITDPKQRLEYDFRLGMIRPEQRLAEAAAGGKPTALELREAWANFAPDRVARSAMLAKKAMAARAVGKLEDAISLGRQAVEDDPFFGEMRATVKAWEQMHAKPRR
jgi:pSer/pThr/pTyr-binding forkhead associated (FHA) protein